MASESENHQNKAKFVPFVAEEHEMLKIWQQERTFEKLRERNRDNENWSFLDGPITANNPMGVHHAWGRTYKDTFQRYHAMNGKNLRYQNGFDCQGLWVEVEVQKALKLNSRKDIEEFGLAKFVAECKKRVLTFAARMTKQSRRLGYWMEWDDPDELLKLADAIVENKVVEYKTARGQVIKAPAEEIVAKLGNPEWGGSYFTFSTNNNETIWTFLKKCFERGKLYRGHDVMPWSGRSGSAYSQMEVADGRKLTVHTSVFVKFPLVDRENENLLVWTTTPWTLTSNVAAAVNPEMDYLKVKANRDGQVYYFAKDNFQYKRLEKEYKDGFGKPDWKLPKDFPVLKTIEQMFNERGGYEILDTVKGAELVGLKYRGPFDDLPNQSKPGGHPGQEELNDKSAIDCHRVVDGGRDNRGKAHVVAGEGTGIVHIAPGCGDLDYRIGNELGLVRIAPLNAAGRFEEGFGEFTGMEAIDKATPELVVTRLKERGLLFSSERYPHVYPHCWRNKDELVFRLVDEWFINMDWREEIKDVTRQIKWLPEEMNGQDKELEWLTNMRDWMISKKRYWGLSLPIWVDEETGDFEVIGTLAELKERAVEGWDQLEGHSPHRPYIDAVKIRNPKTGNVMSRIKDVGNPWLDAGIVPYSTMQYNENREEWKKWFPADFITECFPGQFRNWFYALLSMSTMMEGKPPFKTILGHGLVRDQQGEEMHKSAGNSIPFDVAAEQMGADVCRWMYCAQSPATNINFGPKPAQLVRSRIFGTLKNVYSFYKGYADIDGFEPGKEPATKVADRPEFDRWLLSNLQLLVKEADAGYKSYDLAPFFEKAGEFIDELSNWYVRRNRRRFWKSESSLDKRMAYETLTETLRTLCQILAPAIPFFTDYLYRNLKGQLDCPQSVHHCAFPEANEELLDEDLSNRMAATLSIVQMGRSLRTENKLRVRLPLQALTVVSTNPVVITAVESMEDVVKEEINVKEVKLLTDAGGVVEYNVKPNFKTLGPKFGRDMKAIQQAIRNADAADLADKTKAGESISLELADKTVTLDPEDMQVLLQWQEGYTGASENGILVALDTRLTEELEREGRARDMIRHLQEARKSADLDLSARIAVRYQTESDNLKAAIETWQQTICEEILCTDWAEGTLEGAESTEIKISKEKLTIQLKVVE